MATKVNATSPVPLWKPVAADASRYFSADEVARAKSYQRPLQNAALAGTLISAAVLAVMVWSEFPRRLLDRVGLTGWVWEFFVVIAAYVLLLEVASLPLSIWKTFVHEQKWGFNTQTAKGFVLDEIKGFLIFGIVLQGALLLPVWALIRATDLWWLWGGIAVFAVSLFLNLIYPIAILPAFNKFTPLDDEALRARLNALADRAGVSIGEFLVMDASKRSRKDNAFFVGMGATRRVVIYDNMLDLPHDNTEVVIAHEIGHWRRGHIRRGMLISIVQLPLVLGAIAALLSWDPLLRSAGIGDLGDPAALPLFILVGAVVMSVVRLGDAWISRWQERQADLDALELTRAPDAFAGVWRNMVDRNLPDLAPSWWLRVRMSHPHVVQRLAFGEVWAAARAADGTMLRPAGLEAVSGEAIDGG